MQNPGICREDGCPKIRPCQTHERKRSPSSRRTSEPGYKRKRAEALERDPICYLCGVNPSTVADHVQPAAHGGTNDQLRGACAECNARKSDTWHLHAPARHRSS